MKMPSSQIRVDDAVIARCKSMLTGKQTMSELISLALDALISNQAKPIVSEKIEPFEGMDWGKPSKKKVVPSGYCVKADDEFPELFYLQKRYDSIGSDRIRYLRSKMYPDIYPPMEEPKSYI